MDGDDLSFLTLSDSEKALLAEVRSAVLAAEAEGEFSDEFGSGPDNEHPAETFILHTFARKCNVQLEVLRNRDVAYSLKELVWFVLNLERDPSYMADFSGCDCTEAEAAQLAASLPQLQHVASPQEPEPELMDSRQCELSSPPGHAADLLQHLQASLMSQPQRQQQQLQQQQQQRRQLAKRSLPSDRPQLTLVVPQLPQLPQH